MTLVYKKEKKQITNIKNEQKTSLLICKTLKEKKKKRILKQPYAKIFKDIDEMSQFIERKRLPILTPKVDNLNNLELEVKNITKMVIY